MLLLGTARKRYAGYAPHLLVLGDSLSAAYGIPRERAGWHCCSKNYQTFMSSTPASAATPPMAASHVYPRFCKNTNRQIVIIELGANDGLRGFQIQRIRDNLAQLVPLCQHANAKVLLVGMKIPPNYGLRYTSDFYENYTDTARKYSVPLVPFILQGVATHPELMQDDGIHPRAEAQPKILDNIWPHLQPLL